jgi:hypothetical protein
MDQMQGLERGAGKVKRVRQPSWARRGLRRVHGGNERASAFRRPQAQTDGTVDEEQYILTSPDKLAAHLIALQSQFGVYHSIYRAHIYEHEAERVQLQGDISVFESELKAVVEDYWKEERGDQAPISTERVQATKSRPEKPILGGVTGRLGFVQSLLR